jgi:hypothetical protein
MLRCWQAHRGMEGLTMQRPLAVLLPVCERHGERRRACDIAMAMATATATATATAMAMAMAMATTTKQRTKMFFSKTDHF